MSEQAITIPGADGNDQGFLYTPDNTDNAGKGPWPGVLYMPDIFGIRPDSRAMAKRVAAQGYAVLMPNIFYRTHHTPIFDFEFQMGEERSMKRIHELFAALNLEQMGRDGAAYADFLLARDEVKGSRIAVVGYCFTGKMALLTAAAAPDKIAAAASFHGGHLVTDAPDSPHTAIPKVKAELYFGHAVEDQSMPPDAIIKLDDALKGWAATGNHAYQSEIYEGARHGWTVPGRPEVYNAKQAERHYEKLFDLLKRTLA